MLVNPVDTQELAHALYAALTMPVIEQERRMQRMRAQVDDHNIYRWAGMLLSEAVKLAPPISDRLRQTSAAILPFPTEHRHG